MTTIVTRIFKKSLDWIEAVGNELPHPSTLFALLSILVVLASWLAKLLSFQAIHPADHSVITVNNLLSPTELRWIYTHVVLNFVTFPPLGAMIFHAIGRHPMAGFATAFCCVSGGFGANLMVGANDAILAGLS